MSESGPLAEILAATPEHERGIPTRMPQREYVIWFIARSGSSHLTALLESVRLGVPREWLNPEFLRDQARAFKARAFDEYFGRMRARFTVDGIFGQEMTFGFYQAFSKEVRLEDYFDLSAPCVMLFREDIVSQGISLWRAVTTKMFHATGQGAGARVVDPPYDAEGIGRWIRHLANHERGLQGLFARKGLAPRFLSYEALTAADPLAVVNAFARLVGAPDRAAPPQSSHSKIPAARSDEYRGRFIAEHREEIAQLAQDRAWLFDGLRDAPLLRG
jgi:LPS sulfotransferase NodH